MTLAPSDLELERALSRVTTVLRSMTLIATMTMPRFNDEERSVLGRIERVLRRHPYLRAYLGGTGPIARQLDDVVSARLTLLHTEGVPAGGGPEATLLAQLREWESELVAALADEAGAERVLLRYETTRLLHPEPSDERSPAQASSKRAETTARWEVWRANRSVRSRIRCDIVCTIRNAREGSS